MDEEEKQALEYFRKMQPKTRHMIMAQLIFAAEIEENARKLIREAARQFYDLVGPDGAVPGPAA